MKNLKLKILLGLIFILCVCYGGINLLFNLNSTDIVSLQALTTELTCTSEDIFVQPKPYTGSKIKFEKTDVTIPANTTIIGLVHNENLSYINADNYIVYITLKANEGYTFIVDNQQSEIKVFTVNCEISKKQITFNENDIFIMPKTYTGEKINFLVSDVTPQIGTNVEALVHDENQDYINAGTKTVNVTFRVSDSNHIFIVNNEETLEKTFEVPVTINKSIINKSVINIKKEVVFKGSNYSPSTTWFENVPSFVSITNVGRITKNNTTSTLHNAGTYKVELTITANENYEFENSESTAEDILATVIIKKAQLTILSNNDYIYNTGTKYIEQEYCNDTFFNSSLNINTHYHINSTSTAPMPELEYAGVFTGKNVGNYKLSIDFALQQKDIINYELTNTRIIFNGKIIPALAVVKFNKPNYSFVYGEPIDIPLATTTPTGLEITYKYSSSTYASNTVAPTTPGNYIVTASVSGNFIGSETANYIIEKLDPNVNGLIMQNETFVYSNSGKFLTVSGDIPDYIKITYSYEKQLSDNNYSNPTYTKPKLPGVYKVKANFSVLESSNYKQFSEPTYLEAFLTILSKDISTQNPVENQIKGTLSTQYGVNPNSVFVITKEENGVNIKSSPIGFTVIQSFIAKLTLDNETVIPEGKSIIIVNVDSGLNLNNTKLLVYENGKVIERFFIFKSANDIAFYSNGLGEFAIVSKASLLWILYASGGILIAFIIIFVITVTKSKNREKNEEKLKKKDNKKESKSSKTDEKFLSRQEEIEKLLNLTNKFKK